jgi:type II secretory pathway pseudopilin PulG
MRHLSKQPFQRRRLSAAFTLVELMITVAVVAGAFVSLAALSGRFSNMLRSANDATMITQSLQERMEQIRSASWNTITSEEIPPTDEDVATDDAADDGSDASNEVYTDPTEFPDDLTDADASDPGLLNLLETATPSSARINNLTEEVTVTKYPEGSTPIRIRRNPDGTLTTLSHNPDLVGEYMVRIVVRMTWTSSTGGATRNQSAQLIVTKSSQ